MEYFIFELVLLLYIIYQKVFCKKRYLSEKLLFSIIIGNLLFYIPIILNFYSFNPYDFLYEILSNFEKNSFKQFLPSLYLIKISWLSLIIFFFLESKKNKFRLLTSLLFILIFTVALSLLLLKIFVFTFIFFGACLV